MAAAAAGSSLIPGVIREALAIEANNVTGTLADVEHVVIFMQENRSFDHYFGAMSGVRGFNDPRAITLPGGKPVWYQPDASGGYVLPYHFDVKNTSALSVGTDHNWKGSQTEWGPWNVWVKKKTYLSMGYFDRADLPFYYALADAFTICDAYHCSVFGATDPNRLYALSGSNRGWMGSMGSLYNISPTGYYNNDPAKDNITPSVTASAPNWRTYAETLEANQVSWKVYQEWDNYGDNYLAYFRNFRVNADGTRLSTTSPLYQRGRVLAPGSTEANSKGTKGDWLVNSFADDVRNGRLPAVSWICAPNDYTEHSPNSPNAGENIAARLLAALVANPDTWSKTVFLLTYDENDGFFDHMPAPVPPLTASMGRTTLASVGEFENYQGVSVGLGPRVPMLVVSPWSKGGHVCSQLFDHTSQLRFLEEWLVIKGRARAQVECQQVSPWRRAVCGDLTSAFDFQRPNQTWPQALPSNPPYVLVTGKPSPVPPAVQTLPSQEPCADAGGTRPARGLRYAVAVDGVINTARQLVLGFRNTGRHGAAFTVFSNVRSDGPWYYAVEAGKSIDAEAWAWSGDAYGLSVHGPNGFLREFAGSLAAGAAAPQLRIEYDEVNLDVVLRLVNPGTTAATFTIADKAYGRPSSQHIVAAGVTVAVRWPLVASFGWYDLEVRCSHDASWSRRCAGHVDNGQPTRTDPVLGRRGATPAPLQVAAASVRRGEPLRFTYTAPAGRAESTNWIGLYPPGRSPGKGSSSKWAYAPGASGALSMDTSGLATGDYTAWYLYRDSYDVLGGPLNITIRV
jgi:phospholipase C